MNTVANNVKNLNTNFLKSHIVDLIDPLLFLVLLLLFLIIINWGYVINFFKGPPKIITDMQNKFTTSYTFA